jgi:GNAT superfamily N-acetyltransferase
MDIVITKATPADIEELTNVEIESKQFSIPDHITGAEIDHTTSLNRWQAWFKGRSPKVMPAERLLLKATVDGKIVGFFAGHLTTLYNMDAQVHSFYVLKDYQRKGIGKQLFTKFSEWLNGLQMSSLVAPIKSESDYHNFYLKYGARYLNLDWIFWTDIETLKYKLEK